VGVFCPTGESRQHYAADRTVVAEDPADALANGTHPSLRRRAFDQIVREALVISLAMGIRGEFVQGLP